MHRLSEFRAGGLGGGSGGGFGAEASYFVFFVYILGLRPISGWHTSAHITPQAPRPGLEFETLSPQLSAFSHRRQVLTTIGYRHTPPP